MTAYEIPTTEPLEVTSGNLVTWTRPEHTHMTIADGWVLTYALVITGALISVTATDNGDNTHLVSVAASTTSGWTPGIYKWQAYVTKASERYSVDEGTIEVLTNFASQSTGFDGRSHWKIVLDNVEAVIQNRATKDQSSYTVSGRQLSRTPVGDLIALHKKAKSEVASEERAEAIANGLGNPGKILTRFIR